jgi:protein-S-isoprenylcysteine O-methyltransferase Ste14
MDTSPYLFAQHWSWAAIFFGSYMIFGFGSSWVFGRERHIAQGDNRDRGSKPLIIFLSFAAIGCAFAGPWVMPQARIALPPGPVFATAMVLIWAGALLYAWAIATLGRWFRTSVTLLEGQKLIRSGPYRLLRHPAYTGGILLFAGIGLAMGNWLSFASAALIVALSYVWRIHVEEIALAERFGAEFEAHRKGTWAVLPFLW